MEIPKIHEGEYRFCLILWKHEPVTAAQLAKLCLEQLGWKRTTTYTIIKRLGERRPARSTSWSKRNSKDRCPPLLLPLPSGRICPSGNSTRCSR